MKIVHVEDFFHPNAGYQINILSKYMVRQGHDVAIVTAEMDKIPEYLTSFFGGEDLKEADNNYISRTGVKIIRVQLKGFVSGRAVFQKSLFEKVDELSPDIIYVHGNDTLTGMRYLLRRKKQKYPMVMDSHMLEMASKNPFNKIFRMFYRAVFTPIIKRNNINVIRTQNDDYVEKCLGIPLSQCPWISVGSDTMLFQPDVYTRKTFRKENNISEDDFVVVYAGKFDDSKGGKFLAEALKQKFFCNKKKDFVFVVVGNTSGEYGNEVEDILRKSKNRIIRFQTQKYADLAKFYQAADLSVFPKQCSLSFYDAQACGIPVLSEDNNINVERCSHGNGMNFKSGNMEDFRKKIEAIANMPSNELKVMSQNSYKFVKENYDYEKIAEQYNCILMTEYDRFNNK